MFIPPTLALNLLDRRVIVPLLGLLLVAYIVILHMRLDIARSERDAAVAKLGLSSQAVAVMKREAERASQLAQEAREEAEQARAEGQQRITAVRAVRPSGDECRDAREMINAYRHN